jgi:DNA repair protein RecO (recombination protein O)
MDERSHGLILRTRPLTETSLIVQWLTPDLGRIATVAKGARRPKSPFRGKLDLFYAADFSFARSRKSELHTLREVNLTGTHPALRLDLDRLHQAAYAAAFIEQATETETPLPEIFTLLRDFLGRLETAPTQDAHMLAFELKLLRELGQEPDLEEGKLSPGTRKVAQHLVATDWHLGETLKPSAGQLRELRQFLHGFLIYHLERLPRGRARAFPQLDSGPQG